MSKNERSRNTVLLTSTSSYLRHRTVQCEVSQSRSRTSASKSRSTTRVAHSFGSDKLYIRLSNKCFKVYPVYSLCTDVRPSQDHRILRMQTVRINLAKMVATLSSRPTKLRNTKLEKKTKIPIGHCESKHTCCFITI